MTNDEEIDRLRDLASRMLSMLNGLHECLSWDELGDDINDINIEAKQLNVDP